MILVLSFATSYLACGDYPLLCEIVKEANEIYKEAKDIEAGIKSGKYSDVLEIEIKLQYLSDRLSNLALMMMRMDSLFENDPRLDAVKCNANCPGGSCSCWFCDCGCDSNGNPWCGGGPLSNETGEPSLLQLNESNQIQKPYVGFYTIYDLSGRVVFSGNLNGNLPSLKKGVYFLKDKSGKVSRVVIR